MIARHQAWLYILLLGLARYCIAFEYACQPCLYRSRTQPAEHALHNTFCLQGDIERVREVYDAFLAEFPLCYGYWKKYADAEARLGSLEHAAHVYERGVASIPYSIDLWGHYAMFKQNQGASHEEMQGCA